MELLSDFPKQYPDRLNNYTTPKLAFIPPGQTHWQEPSHRDESRQDNSRRRWSVSNLLAAFLHPCAGLCVQRSRISHPTPPVRGHKMDGVSQQRLEPSHLHVHEPNISKGFQKTIQEGPGKDGARLQPKGLY